MERSDLTHVRHLEVSDRIAAKQSESKITYDKRRAKAKQYEVGHQVLLRKPAGTNEAKSRKLLPKYDGPFVVTTVCGNDRYEVSDISQVPIGVGEGTPVCAPWTK
ncbi:hypothetical protein QE152_g23559 [Popillia japonica]|uniref:Uncharacterized protein n=1 Tax=Popillia japonica TaxID=7064 RepID=A0AAW1KI58_POPJA